MDIVELPIALIDEDKDQPRYQFAEESLQELVQSIEELGLLSPIKVRTMPDGRYKIIYGNRRYKATKMLGRTVIPCIVSQATDDLEIYLEQVAENLTREGFSPIEEAEAFDKLMNDARFRSSTKFLSNKLGKPESYIKNKCELLKFSPAVKRLIVSGTEIRKDKLTEDQLLPLKDLPMEHRDPLALIAARDELPVSDIKKIAKLFKDKDISARTKENLLLKTGSGLIDTWSVYEQNRKERAKAAAKAESETAESSMAGGEAAVPSGGSAGQGDGAAKAAAASASSSQANAAAENGVQLVGLNSEAAGAAASPSAAAAASISPAIGAKPSYGTTDSLTLIQNNLQHLLSAIPAYEPLTSKVMRSLELLHPDSCLSFIDTIDQLLDTLAQYSEEWSSVKEQLIAKMASAPQD